jgi:hypothetical protein
MSAGTTGGSPPLAGLRVLDLSELLPGPYATSLLADLGAEVVKVERPGGDNARAIVPDMVEALNRGKRSICIDLKTEAGRAVLRSLAERSDVLVEGFRPGVTRRLGVDYDRLSALNPRLIYASVSGYGASGPQALRPGHDLNYLSAAGVVGLTQRGGAPTHDVNIPVADIAGSMFAVVSILAALAQRERDGRGQSLDHAAARLVVGGNGARHGGQRGSAAPAGLWRVPHCRRPLPQHRGHRRPVLRAPGCRARADRSAGAGARTPPRPHAAPRAHRRGHRRVPAHAAPRALGRAVRCPGHPLCARQQP